MVDAYSLLLISSVDLVFNTHEVQNLTGSELVDAVIMLLWVGLFKLLESVRPGMVYFLLQSIHTKNASGPIITFGIYRTYFQAISFYILRDIVSSPI